MQRTTKNQDELDGIDLPPDVYCFTHAKTLKGEDT